MDYKSKRWARVRQRILRRDRHLCRECARFGRTTSANVVHHIWPAADHPEYRYADWNLVSLCAACHNAMHDRETDELTERGEALRRKVSPPPSGPI